MELHKPKYWLCIILLFGVIACDLEDELDDAFIYISGTVTENGEAVRNSLVLLVTSASISNGLSLSNGSITGNNGDYNIINVKNGEYYIVAIEDNNSKLEFDIESDRIGFHGVDLEGLNIEPDKITILNEDVENIDITYLTSL